MSANGWHCRCTSRCGCSSGDGRVSCECSDCDGSAAVDAPATAAAWAATTATAAAMAIVFTLRGDCSHVCVSYSFSSAGHSRAQAACPCTVAMGGSKQKKIQQQKEYAEWVRELKAVNPGICLDEFDNARCQHCSKVISCDLDAAEAWAAHKLNCWKLQLYAFICQNCDQVVHEGDWKVRCSICHKCLTPSRSGWADHVATAAHLKVINTYFHG